MTKRPTEPKTEYRLTMSRKKWAVMLTVTIIAAGLLSPWASSSPDGLERVAEDHGFLDLAGALHKWAPIADYEVAGLPGTALQVGAAGLLGVGIMLLVLVGVTRMLARRASRQQPADQHVEGEVDGA